MKPKTCYAWLLAGWQAVSLAQSPSVQLLTEDYPPFNMILPNGEIGGMSTEMVRELFHRAEIPYQIELQPWIRAFNSALLNNNTCVYSTTRSEHREHQFKWVGPLLENPWVLYAGPKSPARISSLEDARPYKIGGYAGDAEAQYLIARGFNVDLTPTDELNARKLALGRLDFWATGEYRGIYVRAQEKLPQLHQALKFNTVLLYLACNSGVADSTIQRLNDILNAMRHDSFSDQVRKRYVGH